jgi:hypothetical protein
LAFLIELEGFGRFDGWIAFVVLFKMGQKISFKLRVDEKLSLIFS